MRPKKELTEEELCKLLYKVYYDFINIFLKKGVNILPPHWPNDHAISLKKGKILLYKRPYLILKDKLLVIKKYINKHLNKGFISSSLLPIAVK